ncbi:MAG: hypothetical protein AB7W37_12700 [Syntrophobacteraceae bacterium]
MTRKILYGLVVILILGGSCGCIQDIRDAWSYKPVDCKPPQVYVKPPYVAHKPYRLAVSPFTAPPHLRGAGGAVGAAYFQEMLRSGLFTNVVMADGSQPAAPMADAGAAGDMDLALQGNILSVLAGSGDTPSQLTVEVQLIDVAKRQVIWYVRQEASSEPGPFVDKIWFTDPGAKAQSYQALAHALGSQLAQIMTPPPEPEDKPVPDPFVTKTKGSY